MKYNLILFFILLFQLGYSQDLIFTNDNLKAYLISENSVDLNGDEIPDTIIDTNNDNEIQLSEALLVQNLVIGSNSTIISIQDIHQFVNLERLTVWGGIGLTEVSNLDLESLQHIRISDHNSIVDIDLSDLPNLNSIYLHGLNGVQNLNLQNGSFASNEFSLFYTYVQSACVDPISSEYDIVSEHLVNGGNITTNCSLGIEDNESQKLAFYPNPTYNKVYFNSKVESIILYNLNGQILNEWNYPIGEIDISELNAGIYILKIKNDEVFFHRVIKK